MIYCISGKAQNGKDYTANVLKSIFEEKGEEALIIHYGDLLKYYAKQYFGWNGLKDEAGRSLLQNVGTNVRMKSPNYWVDHIVEFIKVFYDQYDHFLIADCRYPNEIDDVKNTFGEEVLSIRVNRPGYDNGLTEIQKAHSSETALDDYTFDHVLINNGDESYNAEIENLERCIGM